MNNFRPCRILMILTASLLASACTQHHAMQSPTDPEQGFYGQTGAKGHHVSHANPDKFVFASKLNCEKVESLNQTVHYRADHALIPSNNEHNGTPPTSIFNRDLPLSPGDMLNLQIENGEGFSGEYVLNPDGSLQLPLLSPINGAGLTVEQLSLKIEMALVRAEIFRPSAARASVRVKQWAPVNVTVSGAVFQPGRVTINENRQESVIAERLAAVGDYATKRSIIEALRNASGVRPDAKLDQVILIRQGWQIELDLSGVVKGLPVQDVSLVDGDQVIVPTTGCFQSALVRPSQVTPRGFRVFMSNLTLPALDNAGSAAGRYSSNLPYGSTLLQAAVSSNCVGGTQLTNAPRKVVLASKNPVTKEFQIIERSIEELMRSPHREDINPYLMPNDALACYDSDISNLRDFARSLGDIIGPMKLFF
ncbi:polysaccharide biosynthesis/export family protein [Teredinibacter haidensis]|uniref:polysaccharide biosynthesis/export family protein n=1 Tax=Teredinibacter haidensis TaxID=2731755 RepID=UPI000A9A5EAD|nr:polysaccharide biosynthesis/export family protein [Teredinibacter haidensis]